MWGPLGSENSLVNLISFSKQYFRIPSPKEGKPLPVGVAIIRALKQKVLEFKEKNPDRLTILLNTPVVGLVTWNEYITGVRYQSENETLGKYSLGI